LFLFVCLFAAICPAFWSGWYFTLPIVLAPSSFLFQEFFNLLYRTLAAAVTAWVHFAQFGLLNDDDDVLFVSFPL